jgi:hypothetical protein
VEAGRCGGRGSLRARLDAGVRTAPVTAATVRPATAPAGGGGRAAHLTQGGYIRRDLSRRLRWAQQAAEVVVSPSSPRSVSSRPSTGANTSLQRLSPRPHTAATAPTLGGAGSGSPRSRQSRSSSTALPPPPQQAGGYVAPPPHAAERLGAMLAESAGQVAALDGFVPTELKEAVTTPRCWVGFGPWQRYEGHIRKPGVNPEAYRRRTPLSCRPSRPHPPSARAGATEEEAAAPHASSFFFSTPTGGGGGGRSTGPSAPTLAADTAADTVQPPPPHSHWLPTPPPPTPPPEPTVSAAPPAVTGAGAAPLTMAQQLAMSEAACVALQRQLQTALQCARENEELVQRLTINVRGY